MDGLKVALTYRYPHKAEPYAAALRQAGVEPVLISPEGLRTMAGLQGLLLSGGTDVNPARYGGAPRPGTETPDDERDALETRLLDEALAADLPVLAICRGMQLFNVAHGGTLIQHLENSAVHVVRGNDPSLPAHEIVIEPGTRLAAILGEGVHAVNSRHHQAVERVGAGLRVTATCTADGVIEGLERSDRRFA
ncbi:MAG TPA: gamma-glutamyl-gamma-aminobutyrate hydrolase family protein, partial [Bryobacteraceae bacterium]|nr:gamma-glutamyl-gamma-aminobutyrate hydrolase family protein [Bryobacteraceae bacterium]